MLTLYENIKKRREELGMTKVRLAELVGYDRSMITKIEQGKVDLTQSKIMAIANALNTTPSYLMGWKDESQTNIIDLSKYDNISPIAMKKYPLLGEIACGKPIFAAEDRDSYVLSGTDIPADFCLRAKGDSMINARIQDGDIVFIRKQDTVENGEIAAVIIEDEATLKRFSFFPEKDMVILKPENPKYSDLVYVGDELETLHVLGKAIAFQSDVE